MPQNRTVVRVWWMRFYATSSAPPFPTISLGGTRAGSVGRSTAAQLSPCRLTAQVEKASFHLGADRNVPWYEPTPIHDWYPWRPELRSAPEIASASGLLHRLISHAHVSSSHSAPGLVPVSHSRTALRMRRSPRSVVIGRVRVSGTIAIGTG